MPSDADHCRVRAEQCPRLAGDALRPISRETTSRWQCQNQAGRPARWGSGAL
jgi:hypothetical protein